TWSDNALTSHDRESRGRSPRASRPDRVALFGVASEAARGTRQESASSPHYARACAVSRLGPSVGTASSTTVCDPYEARDDESVGGEGRPVAPVSARLRTDATDGPAGHARRGGAAACLAPSRLAVLRRPAAARDEPPPTRRHRLPTASRGGVRRWLFLARL